MNIIVNIEHRLGMPVPKEHVLWIAETLEVSEADVRLYRTYNTASYWIISNVDDEIYVEKLDFISDYFRVLYERGLIVFFLIKECDEDLVLV